MCKDRTCGKNKESNTSNRRCLETFTEAYFVRKIDAILKTEGSLKHDFCQVV